MCNQFRSGSARFRAGEELVLETPGGGLIRGKWAGSATREKLRKYWLRPPGNQLARTRDIVTEISETDRETGEVIWSPAPPDSHLFFVVEAPPPEKDYHLARLVTVPATASQVAYFHHKNETVPLTGHFDARGEPLPIPLPPLPARPRVQDDLFSPAPTER